MTAASGAEAPPLVDTHLHLDDPRFDDDRETVLRRARQSGVRAVLSCSTDLDSARYTLALARRFAAGDAMPAVGVAVGIHPHQAGRVGSPEAALEALERLAAAPQVRAIGEIGLDFHYDFSPRDVQQELFERQLDLAQRIGKPVCVHAREAEPTVLATIRRYPRVRGVLHAFAGDREQAEQALSLGWYLGVGGMLTFRNADAIRAVVGAVPLERLVLETDAPYLAPVPHRGRRNEPAYVALVAETLASLHALPVEAVAQLTTRAAVELLGLEL